MGLATVSISQIVLTCTQARMHTNPRTATMCFSSPPSFFHTKLMQFSVKHSTYLLLLGAIVYLQTLEHPTGADKEVAKITTTRFLLSELMSAPPPTVHSHNLMSPRLSHVTLDKPLTTSLQRDLLSNLTFATIKHQPCLVAIVEKLECVI